MKSDKGGLTVIMDREHYYEMGGGVINDPNFQF